MPLGSPPGPSPPACERVDGAELVHSWLHRGPVSLHYVEGGDLARRPVVFLHGFPEYWYSWRRQLAPLALAGLHVVGLDLRGYNLSSQIPGICNYSQKQLTDDLAAVIAVTSSRTTALAVVGHGWGALVAWAFAMDHPDKLQKLIVLNGPHPKVLKDALSLWRTPIKALRYWYWYVFQIPSIPEILITLNRYKKLRHRYEREPLQRLSEEDVDK
eukprot:SM000048S16608  [mRNA]  locus=s48:719076:720600:+ [translate_table: standard]